MTRASFLIPGDLSLPTGGYAYDRRVLGMLSANGVDGTHVELPASFPNPTEADLAETEKIVDVLPRDTVLLIDGLAYGAMPSELIRRFDRPIVALCHHPLALEAGLSPARAAELKASETTALGLAHEVIVTSPATSAILTREFAVAPDRITVALPGTDPARRACGTGSPIQLLAVGSLVPRKGYDVLMRALAKIDGRDWHLNIAGADDRSSRTAAELRDLISALGLDRHVTLNGAVSDECLAELYAKADLFVMSSLFEGYGMVLAEAMARGLPIVSTTGGAAAETVPDGVAIKVPPGNVDALTEALRTVLHNAALRTEMANASWCAGRALPKWEDTARIIADVIRKVST
jgi:glycosyltransferase involved in cell wall biosynthesis